VSGCGAVFLAQNEKREAAVAAAMIRLVIDLDAVDPKSPRQPFRTTASVLSLAGSGQGMRGGPF